MLLLGTAAPAVAGPGASVHLGAQTVFISPAEIAQESDVPETAYTLRSASSTQTNDHSGLSMRKLVVLAGANPDTIGFVGVKRPDGTLAYLQGSDLADPPPFPEGPALVWIDGETSRFFRPARDEHDTNAADNIGTATGQPLVVYVHSGPLLTVTASATPTRAAAGAAISFSARAGGSGLRYTWTFDDGTRAHGAQVSHTYKLAGGYNVFVSVAGSGDSGGSSPTLHIVVGNPPPGAAAAPGGGSTKHTAPGGGSTSTSTSTTAPTTTGPAQSGSPARAPSAPAGQTGLGTPPLRPAVRRMASPEASPPPSLPLIHGELLAYSEPLPLARVRAGRGSVAGARAGGSTSTGGILTAAGAALLLVLGAAAEARGGPRRRGSAA